MRCVGKVHEGALRGTYSFTPDSQFAKRMETLGFDGQTPDRLQGYAMLDVTTEWVKELKEAHVKDLTAERLMGLRALKVDAAYVHAMAAGRLSGVRRRKADQHEGCWRHAGKGTGRARHGICSHTTRIDRDERI
jgi:hypothetical protein